MDAAKDLRRQSLSMMLRRSAERFGARIALECGGAAWSYAELDRLADRLANGLAAIGVRKGDRVAVVARNSHAFMALRFAVARSGAVLVPVNFMLHAEEARYILEHAGASLVFADATTLAVVRAAVPGLPVYGLPGEHEPAPADVPAWDSLLGEAMPPPEVVDADDLLQIIYTSGTESRPKGAMLTHAAVLWEYQSVIIDCELRGDAVMLNSMPLYHCAQLDAMIGPALQMGAHNIVTGSPAPDNLLALIERHRVTSLFVPPTVWIGLLRCPGFDAADLSSLTHGYFGASIMPGEVLKELMARLPKVRFWNVYGQTEIAPVATALQPHEHFARPNSCGRPVTHVSTRVVDDDMADVAPGEVGEVVHRSPHLMSGYWNDPEKTAAAFAGGWFHSGDLATVDADGYITIVDRKKDMINSGGENVSSREVEECVYTHPAVAEVAVIGLPDPRWIETVCAVVVPRAGAIIDEAALIAHCRERLAGYKAPKRVIVVEALPKNASGKILKRELRALA
ncbi:MAG: long-chain-fatty-acid--CoA ligase [Sphingomonadales bacterium]|nr:long-chain-fatty-acid--CoA ligase [Sphingomonadales bacterium]